MNEYLESVGGRDFITNGGIKKDNKKRGRPSSGTPTSTANGSKKRKSEPHPKDTSPPLGMKKDFKPPTGSWEEDVQGIDACEGSDGKVMVFLSWANGHKTQHPLEQVYKRCPQKVCTCPAGIRVSTYCFYRCLNFMSPICQSCPFPLTR